MTDPELNRLVEAWKMTVQVQQHFNDVEMKIRGLAITVLTAIVGAAALAIQNGRSHLAVGLFLMGLISWLLFLFVDHVWYHRLLLGAVDHGEAIEDTLGADFGLSKALGKASPVKFPTIPVISPKGELHSTGKLLIFYGGVAVLLLGAMIGTGLFGPDTATGNTSSISTGQHTQSPSPPKH